MIVHGQKEQEGGSVGTLSDLSSNSLFEGVIVTRFDMLLGPTPAVVHPNGFIAGEAIRGVSEDAMLLLSMGKRESLCSIMSFSQIDKVGVVGIDASSHEGATGTIVMFDRQAEGMVWETYTLIRNLINNEFPNIRQHPGEAALRLYEGVRKVCEGPIEEQVTGKPGDKLEAVIDSTVCAINSLLKSGKLDKLQPARSRMKVRIVKLLAVLEESKAQLRY
jgi:hypothetical protein